MGRKSGTRDQRETTRIAVIGEGISEQYYLTSIQGLSKYPIFPKVAKEGIPYLEKEIDRCVKDGYQTVYCLIDKDTKQSGKQKTSYDKFVAKYNNKTLTCPRQKTQTVISIIENHPCLELWFLYHFQYTTADYCSFESFKHELLKALPDYQKRETFLRKTGGLHSYLIRKGGDFSTALGNSERSMQHINRGNSGAFSQMKMLFDEILNEK